MPRGLSVVCRSILTPTKMFPFMKLNVAFALTFLCAIAGAAFTQDSHTLGPAKGNLVIVGGGRIGPEIWAKFIELAGGAERANVVVVPTAGESVPDDGKVPATGTPDALSKLGVKHVTILHNGGVVRRRKAVAPRGLLPRDPHAEGVRCRSQPGRSHWRIVGGSDHSRRILMARRYLGTRKGGR